MAWEWITRLLMGNIIEASSRFVFVNSLESKKFLKVKQIFNQAEYFNIDPPIFYSQPRSAVAVTRNIRLIYSGRGISPFEWRDKVRHPGLKYLPRKFGQPMATEDCDVMDLPNRPR